MLRLVDRCFVAILGCMISSVAVGVWSSGGGEMRTDTLNPWFIQNTTTVRYCVDLDELNFGASSLAAHQAIDQAIAFWQGEFSRAGQLPVAPAPTRLDPAPPDSLKVQVATQQFTEVSCAEEPDLAFQFGVLSKEQADYLKTPPTYVGVAVRTDYDLVHMKGRGFIYVSPERGPLAPTGPDLLLNRWKLHDSHLLQLLLIHEMGHVFGVQHIGNNLSIMGESFPAGLVDKTVGPYLAYATTFPQVFPSFRDFNVCMPWEADFRREWPFGVTISPTVACIQGKVSADGKDIHLSFMTPNHHDPYHDNAQVIGDIHLYWWLQGIGEPVQQLILPPTQQVYANLPQGQPSIEIPGLRRLSGFGEITSQFDHHNYLVSIRFEPSGTMLEVTDSKGRILPVGTDLGWGWQWNNISQRSLRRFP